MFAKNTLTTVKNGCVIPIFIEGNFYTRYIVWPRGKLCSLEMCTYIFIDEFRRYISFTYDEMNANFSLVRGKTNENRN